MKWNTEPGAGANAGLRPQLAGKRSVGECPCPGIAENMSTVLLAVILLLAATIVAVLSIPLILRKIPMNPFYGAQFSEAFQSEENWYEINHYAEKAFLFSTIPIFVMALAGLLFWHSLGDIVSKYSIIIAAVILVSLFSAVAAS